MNDTIVTIPVEGFEVGDKVVIGKGKKLWRIKEIGRQEVTLTPINGRKGCRDWWVKNSEVSTRLKKVGK